MRYAGGVSYLGAITQQGQYNANIAINHSTLSDNGKPAVYLGSSTGILASAVVNNSSIYGNTSYGIYSGFSPAMVNAENNWWGSDSGPAPYGSGNGINYRTYTCGTPPVTCYDYGTYVDAVPWMGQPGLLRPVRAQRRLHRRSGQHRQRQLRLPAHRPEHPHPRPATGVQPLIQFAGAGGRSVGLGLAPHLDGDSPGAAAATCASPTATAGRSASRWNGARLRGRRGRVLDS